jgi:hypothetical protein
MVGSTITPKKQDLVPVPSDEIQSNVNKNILSNEMIQKDFVNPSPDILKDTENLIWIKMTAMPVYKLSVNARNPATISTKLNPGGANEGSGLMSELLGARRYTFKFLASQELMENISHSWEAYDSVASMASKAMADFGIALPEQIKGIVAAMGPKYNTLQKASFEGIPALNDKIIKDGIGQTLKDIATSLATNGNVANYRVDTPLQYKGSERRTWELIFTLVNTMEQGNYNNVVLPVKMLQSLSSPAYSNDDDKANADIILPYLFELHTESKSGTDNLISCDLAVLKSVNPTYKGPWIQGQPSRCDLRLSFTEYRPLESKVFFSSKSQKSGKINAMLKERPGAYDEMRKSELWQFNDDIEPPTSTTMTVKQIGKTKITRGK